ncbi:ABC-2 transporter permease [Candidatus Xianfuyuplasma coldseepsis]|uniref:ABC-2 transporter permease n=1 Tax=Candidatus Xianfuyuplasma coldseepsis TaxID=2782163 RepID=A0A7L7KR47_9MOLU|nr:ABC-2 transporter permease [Xianfuyuplasma coldseepsis]QMS85300.1 hypothetical protein G4Z02_05890 [Xianfuyuplasma coldseepsis]
MKPLIYKELTLSIHKFFFLLPLLLAALMLIPNWIFMLVFMYFFWISIPQIYSAYLANGDYNFTSVLPIKRDDIVTSKAYALFILEGVHIAFAVIFGILHNILYGQFNLFMDINLAFFGVVILLYGLFNVIFLPAYFKTAHHFGLPTIYAVVATLVYGFIFEYGAIKFQWMRDVFEGTLASQITPFLITTVLGVVISIFAIKRSQHNFADIDL